MESTITSSISAAVENQERFSVKENFIVYCIIELSSGVIAAAGGDAESGVASLYELNCGKLEKFYEEKLFNREINHIIELRSGNLLFTGAVNSFKIMKITKGKLELVLDQNGLNNRTTIYDIIEMPNEDLVAADSSSVCIYRKMTDDTYSLHKEINVHNHVFQLFQINEECIVFGTPKADVKNLYFIDTKDYNEICRINNQDSGVWNQEYVFLN